MTTIKLPGHPSPVVVADILYLKGENNYTRFYLSSGQWILASLNLGYYEALLTRFIRIHKQLMVNPQYVVRIERMGYIEGTVTLLDTTTLPVAKRRIRSTLAHLRQRAGDTHAEVVF
jgi:DNA-binding LytR/AlgR family response regulator